MEPILLFDGDCAFCTASVTFLQRYIRPRARIVAWQRADLGTLGVSEQECQESIQWFVAPGSPPLTQGRAVAAALRTGSAPWPLVGRLMQVPGIVEVMNAAYRVVAANRFRLPGSTPACRLPDPATAPARASTPHPDSAPSRRSATPAPSRNSARSSVPASAPASATSPAPAA